MDIQILIPLQEETCIAVAQQRVVRSLYAIMPWNNQVEWQWSESDHTGKNKKDKSKGKLTELDMYPWVCTQPGCTQTKNWNCFNVCKSCRAPRITPPLTQLPGQQAAVDWEAKYKALEAQTKKAAAAATEAAAAPKIEVDTDSDTDTDTEAEVHAKFHQDLEKVIAQFEDMGKAIPELEVIKKLVNVTKTSEKQNLTNTEIEQEIIKSQKLIDELDESLQTLRLSIRQQEGTLDTLRKKLAESEERYKATIALKEKWLSERLERHKQDQQNKTPDDAPWEKQAAQRKKEKKQAQKKAAEGKQLLTGGMPELFACLDALTKAAAARQNPKAEAPYDVDMEDASEKKRKAEEDERKAKRAARAATAAEAAAVPNAADGL